ncbi:MAG: Gfo/Idh/MocA family oxidoreductase [Patescibacteria group bacterium]
MKIIGAGSIGNHLAQACRRINWEVTVVDRDEEALRRMREDIYPKRYGSWDESIKLSKSSEEPKGGFDVIFIGTPPDTHLAIAINCLEEDPKILHIEKPLCTPSLEGLVELKEKNIIHKNTMVFTGYDHVVAESIECIADLLKKNSFGNILTMDVEFREHWQGIFNAHPWLKGPHDSYLGFTNRGGGASGEHSHALNLWQFFAHVLGWGKIKNVSALIEQVKTENYFYDSIFALNLVTDSGHKGRVIQDVITLPTRKWSRIQGDAGFIEWYCNGVPEGDLIKYRIGVEGEIIEKVFPKKRTDDFYRLVNHYQKILSGELLYDDSQLKLERGIETMEVIQSALKDSGIMSK